MASGRISIDIGLNASGVAKGAKDAEKALEKLEDAVGDAGKQGGRDLDAIEDELKDVQRQSRRTGDDLEDGFKRAKRGADEFKAEAASSARESAASFDGSAESISDVFQEVAANAFGGFGPAGAAAGIAVAAGFGIALEAINAQQEALDELKEKFADVYRAAAEEGRAYLDEAQIQAGVLDILFDPKKKEAALKTAQLIGADLVTIARAESGSREDIAAAIDLANQKAEELQSTSQEATGTTSVWAAGAQSVASKYEQLGRLLDANEQAARLAQESSNRGHEQERNQIDRTANAAQARYEAMAQRYAKPIKVKLEPDDTALRNYRPRPIRVTAQISPIAGRRMI